MQVISLVLCNDPVNTQNTQDQTIVLSAEADKIQINDTVTGEIASETKPEVVQTTEQQNNQ